MLQAALNGAWTKADHPALPVTPDELVRDAVACVRAGARAIHLHPRDMDGRETLDPILVDAVVGAVRSACGAPVGVSTGAWIEPDLDRRLDLIRAWRAPDFASVNLSEEGAPQVMEALIEAGVGIGAGIATAEDVDRLAATGLEAEVTRILVEPVDATAARAEEIVRELHLALDRCGLTRAPRLQHADGEGTWIATADAVRRGLDPRVGLEDTFAGPDGRRAEGNEALVRAAASLVPPDRP